ncbi:transposase [Thermodesulfatator autotrophicus]|uniref:transposase n=1 Tax=Thermodesulfatator autotrophicus TaxID=1795632 RepID=UPI0009EDE7CC
MFKILILQSLYNLSDDAPEVQILDRPFGDWVPDAKATWLFREDLKEAGVFQELF